MLKFTTKGKNILLGFTALIVGTMISSCERPEGFIGTEYYSAPATGFTASGFQAKRATVDFTSQQQFFTGSFSQKVSWQIEMVGQKSTAVASFSGSSDKLDSTNTTWNGIQTNEFFFEKNEDVIATLTFLGSNIVLKDTFKITQVPVFPIIDIANFDNSAFGYNFLDAPNEVITNTIQFGTNAIQGKGYQTFHGIDKNKSYFILGGGLQAPVKGWNLNTSNPDSVYFNVYVYGYGNPNATMTVNFDEDDNGDGIFTDPTATSLDEEYAYQIKADWVGWKLISVKYSDVPNSGNYKKGNGKHEPQNLVKMGFVLISSPSPGNDVQLSLDMANFTLGKAFSVH